MHRKSPRLTDDEVASILDGSVTPGRHGRGLVDMAQALAPSVTPRAAYRDQLKAAMMREHRRLHTEAADGMGIDAASEHAPIVGHQPVSLVFDGVQVDMADLDKIDPRESVKDALLLLEIAGVSVRDRHTNQ